MYDLCVHHHAWGALMYGPLSLTRCWAYLGQFGQTWEGAKRRTLSEGTDQTGRSVVWKPKIKNDTLGVFFPRAISASTSNRSVASACFTAKGSSPAVSKMESSDASPPPPWPRPPPPPPPPAPGLPLFCTRRLKVPAPGKAEPEPLAFFEIGSIVGTASAGRMLWKRRLAQTDSSSECQRYCLASHGLAHSASRWTFAICLDWSTSNLCCVPRCLTLWQATERSVQQPWHLWAYCWKASWP
mmetsp:Transcript_146001/g.468184  ORF Transcript_146001/g.468184 Transcript_146001/m.468184 type:complete len:241 (+) Transcript_146001:809-1531(+)